MPDAVEQMVYVHHDERSVPWHGLGNRVEEAMTARQAMELGGLDFEVELWPIAAYAPQDATVVEDGAGIPESLQVVENRVAVVRTTDGRIYQIASDRYRPKQNAAKFEFFDTLVDSGDAKYETAGSLHDGAVTFLSAKTSRTIRIEGLEELDLYVVMRDSFDSTMPFGLDITPIRPVCKNTVIMGMKAAKRTWSIKHTASMDGRVEQAREALGITFEYADELEGVLNRLTQEDFTKARFEQLIREAFPGKKAQLVPFTPEQYAMIGVLESSPTLQDPIRYTKYGALQAVVEFMDWGWTPRESQVRSEAEQRTERALGWSGTKARDLDRFAAMLQDA